MPQILNTVLTPDEEFAVSQVLSETVPELSVENFSQQLKLNGISISSLATLYANALMEARPAVKLKAIRELLEILGVDRKQDAARKQTIPQISIKVGENSEVNLISLLAPERQMSLKG